MQNLNPPTVDPDNTFEAIVNAKMGQRRNQLRTLTPQVQQRFSEYANCRMELARINPSPFNGGERDDLLHCYEVSTLPLSKLKASIRTAQRPNLQHVCQYCGFAPASGFDHYLAKSIYPEFSVNALNLIPSCSECNGLKDDKFLSDGSRSFVNFYYDAIPTQRFLFAYLIFTQGYPVVQFQLQNNGQIDLEMFRRLESHFLNLNLYVRLKQFSTSSIAEARAVVIANASPGDGATEIAGLYQTAANALFREFSPNHWKASLFEALSRSEQFCEMR